MPPATLGTLSAEGVQISATATSFGSPLASVQVAILAKEQPAQRSAVRDVGRAPTVRVPCTDTAKPHSGGSAKSVLGIRNNNVLVRVCRLVHIELAMRMSWTPISSTGNAELGIISSRELHFTVDSLTTY